MNTFISHGEEICGAQNAVDAECEYYFKAGVDKLLIRRMRNVSGAGRNAHLKLQSVQP